jgi:hypothetical protein
MKKSRTLLVAVLGVVAALALGTVAYAAAADTDTTFKMEAQSATSVKYSGKVTSDDNHCIKGRKVVIIHRGVTIARTETDGDGKWSVIGPRPPKGDNVTAKVKPKRKHGKTICKGTKVTKEFRP